jgi:hypothetical protein
MPEERAQEAAHQGLREEEVSGHIRIKVCHAFIPT